MSAHINPLEELEGPSRGLCKQTRGRIVVVQCGYENHGC